MLKNESLCLPRFLLKNKTLPKSQNKIHQNFCRRNEADFENLQSQPRTKPKKRIFAKLA